MYQTLCFMDEDLVILELNTRWGCDIPFGWIPITGDQKIPGTETYDAEYFNQFTEAVRIAIGRLYGINEVYEVLEGGAVNTQLLSSCFLGYDGLEHLYTNFNFDFVLYFSHENSVTVGGRLLLDDVHNIWPEYENHFWANSM